MNDRPEDGRAPEPGPAPPADDRAQYTADEQQRIRTGYAEQGAAECPRCGVRMHARAIGGGSFGLGYARKREWLMCARCHRSALFDVKRGTRN